MCPILSVQELRFAAGDRQVQLSFELPSSKLLHVSGPSGAGKTTLLRVLARLRPHQTGTLRLGGKPVQEVTPTSWRRRTAFLPQRPVVSTGSVLDNLKLPFECRASSDSFDRDTAVRFWQSLGLNNTLLDRPAAELSGGEASRMAVVRALIQQPDVLLADEPTAFLDDNNAQRLISVVTDWVANGHGAVVVAHDVERWREHIDHRLELEAQA